MPRAAIFLSLAVIFFIIEISGEKVDRIREDHTVGEEKTGDKGEFLRVSEAVYEGIEDIRRNDFPALNLEIRTK